MPRILMVSGSLRAGSTNTAVLQTARDIAPDGLELVLYDGLERLPQFNPDDDPDGGTPTNAAVLELRASIAAADAVLFSTPEYAGGLPGSFKNLLDWTVGGGEIYGKPVAWINASSASGAVHAHESLRLVLGYVGASVIEAACVNIPVPRAAVTANGLIADATIRQDIAAVLHVIAQHMHNQSLE